MQLAKKEGIVFVTAKIGEGGNYDDPADAGTLTAARDAGIPVLGGYYVPRTPGISIADQVDHCIKLLDRGIPWWRDFDNYFHQVDLERWKIDNVAAKYGIEFGNRIQDKTGHRAAMYASKGQYGDQLTAWEGILWNANYPSSRQAGFKELYVGAGGDNGPGWASYSGREDGAEFWQYASSATIAGKTTCDANAFRGTLPELITLIGGKTMTAPTPQQNAKELMSGLQEDNNNKGYTGKVGITAGTDLGGGADAARNALAQSKSNGSGISELKVAVGNLQTSVDAIMRDTTTADKLAVMDGKLDQILTLLQSPAGGSALSGTIHVSGDLQVTDSTTE